MKLGAENKKSVYALAGLGVLLAGLLYYNYSDSAPTVYVTPKAAAPQPTDTVAEEASRAPVHGRVDEFLPKLHAKNADKNPPLPKDPTLRLDLLAKLEKVPAAGSGRDLFNFGKPAPVNLAGAEPRVPVWKPIGPPHINPPAPKVAAVKPAAPPPPPINLKYYGICTTRPDGSKTAFFMDGDDILLASEGTTLKGRYRLLRIGVNSAVVEDLQYKHEQTLPLAEDAQPGTGE